MTAGIISALLLSLPLLTGGGQEVTLLFAGDAMQHMPQVSAATQADGSLDYSQCLLLVEPEIKQADYAVVNLECPLGGKPYSGFPRFSAPDQWAQQLMDSGFDLLLTANNHCLDRRDNGLRRTIAALDSIQAPHIGTYLSPDDRQARLPHIVDIKGVKIAMLCYTYGTNGIPPQGDVVVDLIDRQVMSHDIDSARSLGAQIVCVNLHWGVEYQTLPSSRQLDLADWLVYEKGVDLVIGGHPHVVQPMEMRHTPEGKDALVVYSLGNFISNQTGADSRGGAIVKVTLTLGFTGEVASIKASYSLFFCQKPAKRSDTHQLIPAHRPDLVRPDSKAAFQTFIQNARDLLGSHNVEVPEADPDADAAPERPFLNLSLPATQSPDSTFCF